MVNRDIPRDEIFTSWKEIASYLGKGVRTVQRWEHGLGLPVRRPDVKAKNTVLMSRAELDAWVARRWSPAKANSSLPLGDAVRDSRRLRAENSALVRQVSAALAELVEQCNLLNGQQRPTK